MDYSGTTGAMTDAQINYGFGLTFQATGKAPIISHRIWDTLEHLQEYVDNVNQTAIAGLHVSVVEDTDDNNGLYFVKSIGDGTNAGVLVKMATLAEVNEVAGDVADFSAITDADINALFTETTGV